MNPQHSGNSWTGIIKLIMDRLNAMGEKYPERHGLHSDEFDALKKAVREYQKVRKRRLPDAVGPFMFRNVWIYRI